MSWIGAKYGAWIGGWFGRVFPATSDNHIRQQVREAFATQITGLDLTGANVFQSRTRRLAADELPAIRLYTGIEVIEDDDIVTTPYMQHRIIVLRVEVLDKAATGLTDRLNTICEQVETAISNNPTLDGLSPLHAVHRHYDEKLTGGSDQPTGMATMDWEFVVLTMSDAPKLAL